MANVISSDWTSAVSGSFAKASNWSPNGVPNASPNIDYDVYIGGSYTAGTAAFTVTSPTTEWVSFLDIGANADFSVTGGEFIVNSYASSNADAYNYGAISVAAGTTLEFGASDSAPRYAELQNLGSVAVSGVLSSSASVFALLGSGTLTLSGKIVGAMPGAVVQFANKASTVVGSGMIGNGSSLELANGPGGLIDANAAKPLTINTGSNWIYNEGTIETTGAGGLVIDSDMQLDGTLSASGTGVLALVGAYVQSGGAVNVASKAVLWLSNSQINSGGLVSIAAGGKIATQTGNTTRVGTSNAYAGDALAGLDIEDQGSIIVANDSTLNMAGTVYNSGAISLYGASGPTLLEVFEGGLTILNSGGLLLSNSAQNEIGANGTEVSLDNDTKILGAGVIGDGWLRLSNRLGATINAHDSASLTIVGDSAAVAAGGSEDLNGGTIINTGSGGLIFSGGRLDNAGYIIEDGTGALILSGVDIDSGPGIIKALEGQIFLENNAQITGQGYVSIASGASLSTVSDDTSTYICTNVLNQGAINLAPASTQIVDGSWMNNGSIVVGSAAGGSTIEVHSGDLWVLTGGGSLDMSNGDDKIVSAGASTRFVDRSNLITGGGTIGDSNMEFDIMAGAKLDATSSSGMILNMAGQYNAGIIQSDSAAGVTINNAIYSPGQLIADAGAKIVANGAVSGFGTTTINGTGSVEFHAAADTDVYFGAATGGDLILDASKQLDGDIWGLAAGDTIDLRDFAYVSSATGLDNTASYFGALDSTLYVTNGASDSTGLNLEGNYTSTFLAANHLAFQFASDGQTIGGSSSDGTLVKLVSTA